MVNNNEIPKIDVDIDEEFKKNIKFGIRHLQSFLVFWAVAIAYGLRVNLSVAIVAMTDKTDKNYKAFEWDQQKKSLLLSSFFWGYLVNQIPGGQLSKKYGAKYTLIIAILFSSILTIITPILTSLFDWPALLVIRILEGVIQGFTIPSVHTFLSKWSPVNERPRLSVFVYSGMIFGIFLMMITSGVIISNLGWPSVFYLSGSVGVIWTIIWQIYGSSTPAENSIISKFERNFIQQSLGHLKEMHKNCYIPTPWLKIFTSKPFYAVLVTQCCHLFGFTMLLTESPIFFNGVYGVSIEQNALISSLPYLGRFIMEYIFVLIEYQLSTRNLIKTSISRKCFNSISQFLPAIGLVILGFIPKGYLELTVLILVISSALNGASNMGFQVNHIDLAPNHAGTLMGLCNFFSTIIVIMAPIIVGTIVTDEHNQQEWQIIFIISSCLQIFGGLVFITFGSTNTQKWNEVM